MKSQVPSVSSKFLIHSGLATALGVAVAATQVDAALVSLTPSPEVRAFNNIADFEISTTGVLVLNHSQFSSSRSTPSSLGQGPVSGNFGMPNFNTTAWSSVSGATVPVSGTWHTSGTSFKSSNRTGRVVGAAGVDLAAAKRGASAFTVAAAMFATASVNVAKGTNSGSPAGTTGNAVSDTDNYIPVKFNLGAGNLYGLAKVDFNESGTGYTKLLNFWYSDIGAPIKWDGTNASEVSAVPEVDSLIPTALLVGMAAMVRMRRKDRQAGSLAVLAAGVGGLMARAIDDEGV